MTDSTDTSHSFSTNIVLKILPRGSFRRKAASFILKISHIPYFFYMYCLHTLWPIQKKTINFDSNKVLYIGHSYHSKTKSTDFLIEYLKQFYEVEILLDESWQGKPFPDLSFVDNSYFAVIFFQSIPSKKVVRSIDNKNIIFFPMYDAIRHNFSFWCGYYDLKIVNFSKTLHNKLNKWGFDSMYVQYFPKPIEFNPGNANEAFFWQRLTRLNINQISTLLGHSKIRLHIHKATDPGQEFQQPDDDQVSKLSITYSNWFKTRSEMWELIKQKGIFIAPRDFEGIGLSFLEAMSMGKAVIAVNNPTMNEYITHGFNGFLFNLKSPLPLDLSAIEQIQKNTYEFMENGHRQWETEKHKIVEFIGIAK